MENNFFSLEFGSKIESSPVPLALFEVELRKLTPVCFSRGLLEDLSFKKEEALQRFKEDPLFLLQKKDRGPVSRALELFLTKGAPFDEALSLKFGKHTTYHEIRITGKAVSFFQRKFVYFLFIDLNPYLQRYSSPRTASLELDNRAVLVKKEVYDALTGLPTMSFFCELAKVGKPSIESRGETCAMLAFDYMGIKTFNLKNGTEEGDALIRGLGRLLSLSFTPLCCARFGADHCYAFASVKNLEPTLSWIFQEVKKLNNGNSLPLRVGVYRMKKGEGEAVLDACDKAKFASDFDRQSYSSHFTYFTPEMEKSIAMRDYVLTHLDEALSKNWIQAYYQPIVRSSSGQVCAEEALARWVDPSLGLVEPKDFISCLEEAHLLYKIDLRMVSLIIQDFKTKQRLGVPLLPVSINLSRFDFEQGDMVGEIVKLLQEGGFPPTLVNIEITEAVAGRDPGFIRRQIERFHKAGFKVWMDDFGAGYSSLNVLSDFDFDLVKFDMKFMASFPANPKSAPLLSSLLDMASALGVDTLCEGVESRDQLIFLQNHGCDRIQGFYFQRPLPLSETIANRSRFTRESPLEAPYFQKVGEFSLEHPFGFDGSTGAKAGILEYQNGKFHLLRSTQPYRDALEKAGLINFSSFSKTRLPFLKEPPSAFCDAVERCIASGNYEETPLLEKGLATYVCRMKEIARRGDGDPAYAILVQLEPSNESHLLSTFPFPSATAKLLFAPDGEPSDILFLSSTPFLDDFLFQRMRGIEGKKLSELEPGFDPKWLRLALACLKQNRDIRGETHSRAYSRDLVYRFSPKKGEKDVFFCRMFEIQPGEFLQAEAEHRLRADDPLYKASVCLLRKQGKEGTQEALDVLRKGLGCQAIHLYGAFSSSCSLLASSSYLGKPAKFHLGEEETKALLSCCRKNEEVVEPSQEELPSFLLCPRTLLCPVRSASKIVGVLVLEGYASDRKEESVFALGELGSLLLPRFQQKQPKKVKKAEPLSKGRKGSLLRRLDAPSLAERDCLESYNMGFLLFGAPFFCLLLFLLAYLGTKGSSSSVGVDLFLLPSYALPRLIWLSVYLAISLFAFFFCLLLKKRTIAPPHWLKETVLFAYLLSTSLIATLLSWQEDQLGYLSLASALSMMYLSASFRLSPIKSTALVGASSLLLWVLVAFVPCLSQEGIALSAPSKMFWATLGGAAAICLFLAFVLYGLFLRMLHLSTVDPLTQARNRFALNLDKDRYYGKDCFLMVLDIDDFKHWNDSFGHEKGDALLSSFASCLIEAFGEESVYRYGGDEFLVIKEEERASFLRRNQSFREKLSSAFKGNENVSFTAGFEKVSFQDEASFSSAVSEVDALLYEGKKSGKATVVER